MDDEELRLKCLDKALAMNYPSINNMNGMSGARPEEIVARAKVFYDFVKTATPPCSVAKPISMTLREMLDAGILSITPGELA